MAKLTRLLLGGVFGAGLAYLFSRKDVRNRLLGGGRPQLPSAAGPQAGFCPTAAAPEIMLEEETIEVPEVEGPAGETETVAATEDVGTAETVEAATVIETGEIVVAEETAGGVEEIVAEEVATVPESHVEAEAAPETVTPEETSIADETAGEDEFVSLSTPVAGEPTMGEEAPVKPEPEVDSSGPAASQIDRDEMRRRIDETRARLKAKAFDALISGETYVETEEEEKVSEKRTGSEARINKDLEEQIDRSFMEED